MSNQTELGLENFLELIEQVLDAQPTAAVNSPAPSVSNFSQSAEDLTFTEQEINQLERVITELEPAENQKNIKQELKTELKEELKFELLEEKKTVDDQKETFKKELVNYSLEYASVEVVIQSGKSILGILSNVKADFIVIINRSNQFVKVPISKIIAVKEVTSLEGDKQEKKNNKVEKEPESEKISAGIEAKTPLPAPEKLLAKEFITVETNSRK